MNADKLERNYQQKLNRLVELQGRIDSIERIKVDIMHQRRTSQKRNHHLNYPKQESLQFNSLQNLNQALNDLELPNIQENPSQQIRRDSFHAPPLSNSRAQEERLKQKSTTNVTSQLEELSAKYKDPRLDTSPQLNREIHNTKGYNWNSQIAQAHSIIILYRSLNVKDKPFETVMVLNQIRQKLATLMNNIDVHLKMVDESLSIYNEPFYESQKLASLQYKKNHFSQTHVFEPVRTKSPIVVHSDYKGPKMNLQDELSLPKIQVEQVDSIYNSGSRIGVESSEQLIYIESDQGSTALPVKESVAPPAKEDNTNAITPNFYEIHEYTIKLQPPQNIVLQTPKKLKIKPINRKLVAHNSQSVIAVTKKLETEMVEDIKTKLETEMIEEPVKEKVETHVIEKPVEDIKAQPEIEKVEQPIEEMNMLRQKWKNLVEEAQPKNLQTKIVEKFIEEIQPKKVKTPQAVVSDMPIQIKTMKPESPKVASEKPIDEKKPHMIPETPKVESDQPTDEIKQIKKPWATDVSKNRVHDIKPIYKLEEPTEISDQRIEQAQSTITFEQKVNETKSLSVPTTTISTDQKAKEIDDAKSDISINAPQQKLKDLLKFRRASMPGSKNLEMDINKLMVNYLKRCIVQKVSDKIKEEMKHQETDEQREELYEQLVVDEYLGQRNIEYRIAKEKFKKINVNLVGHNPKANEDRDKYEPVKVEAKDETPAEKLQKQLDQIARVRKMKDQKLSKINYKVQPRIQGSAMRLIQEREEQRNKFYKRFEAQSQDRLLKASQEIQI